MHVVYVLWGYPVRSEQFVAREITGLVRHGVSISVVVIGGQGEEEGPDDPAVRRIVRVANWSRVRWLWMACRAISSRPSLAGRLARYLWRTGAQEGSVGVGRAFRMALPALGLSHMLRAEAPEVIHAHFANSPALFARLLATLLENPWGVSLHAHDLYSEQIDLEARLAGASYVLVCSKTALADIRARLSSPLQARTLLVEHGVDVDLWCGSEDARASHTCLVLAAGRFQPKKGFETLVEACAELDSSGFDFHCELIGDGPLRARLEASIRAHSLDRRVTLVPWLSPELLRRRMLEATVLVVPSIIAEDGDRDNIPNVLVEALLLEVPVIASDLPAIREVLAPDEAGELVPPGQSAELASAIRRLCDNPALIRKVRSKAARRSVASRFDLRANCARMLGVLDAARSNQRP